MMFVDDESIEREGLRLMLERNREEVEVVAEAQNGKQAIELALSHKPDLIFMDIKMPEIDGLEAVKQILVELPNTKCVMVSAFDTFDYAREAMKFGIKEYLLKPSKVAEVLEAYDRMVAELESERQKEAEKTEINYRLERASSLVEAEFIVSLMMDHVYEFSVDEWRDWLDLEKRQGFVAVFSFESTHLHPGRDNKSEWYRILKKALQEEHPHCLVGPLTGFQVPAFMFHEVIEGAASIREDFARSIIRRVQQQLQDCRLLSGVGMVVSDVNDFSKSYEEAIFALEFVHDHPGASYMVFTSQLKQKRRELIPFEVEKELVDAVKKGDIQHGLQMFDTYYKLILQAADYQLATVKKALGNFFIVLTRSMKELGFEDDVQMSFAQLDTSTQIKATAKAYLSTIIEQIGEWRANGIEGLLIQAKDYIDCYYHKSISLEEVAEQIGLSSYYLSKLFKEQYQVTFIEYLTQVRLEKAKNFLLEGTLPLKEIALTIGYKDPNYFSRVFKKETGLSPREYRNNYVK
ncbi:response regulator [Lederbergia galactosidilytica]|uniref:response regulator n=1 Tax=Lederbergia galactosidilytica TaxID=217031 RepID=UPI0030844B07